MPISTSRHRRKRRRVENTLGGRQFDPRYAVFPGMLYMPLQRVAPQNVKLVEITPTFCETRLFIDQLNTQIVFDLLFQTFFVAKGALTPKISDEIRAA